MPKQLLQIFTGLFLAAALAFAVPASAKTILLPPGAVPSIVVKVKTYTKVKYKTKIVKGNHGHKKRVKVPTKTKVKVTTYRCPPGYTFGKDLTYCVPSAPTDSPSSEPNIVVSQPDPGCPQPTTPDAMCQSLPATDPTVIVIYVPQPVISDPPSDTVCAQVIIVDPKTGENMSPCAPTNPRIKVCNPDGDSTPDSKIPNCTDIFPYLTDGKTPGGMKKGVQD